MSGLPKQPPAPFLRSLYLQPTIVALAGYGCGIVLASHARLPVGPAIAVTILLLFPLWLARRRPVLFITALFGFSVTFGAVRAASTLHAPSENDVSRLQPGIEIILEGRIDEVPELTRHGTRFFLQASRRVLGPQKSQVLSGRILVYVPEKLPDLACGDRLRAQMKLWPPRRYRTPGAFDYQRYLERRNVRVVGHIRDARYLAVFGDSSGHPLQNWFLQVRNRLDDALSLHLPPSSAGLAKAFLIGRRADLSQEAEDVFRRAGVVHILSISGLHMAVVGLATFGLLWRLLAAVPGLALRLSVRKIAAAVAIGPTLFYLFLAGAEPPAVRSTLLIGLFCLAQMVERPKEPFHALAVSAWLILLVRPLLLFEISFQLTFLSVLGILLAMRAFPVPEIGAEGIVRWLRRPLRWLFLGLYSTVGATLLTAPVVLQAFNIFSPVSILSNLVVAPLSSVAVVVLLLVGPLALLDSTAVPVLFQPVHALLEGITRLSDAFANLPAASLWLPEPTHLETALLLAVGICILLIRSGVGRWGIGLSVMALTLVVGTAIFEEHGAKTFRAVFLDVGQGDAAWVRLPSGKTLLIDAGGGLDQTFDIGRIVVARYLWLRKHPEIDVVAISHPHPDHADGVRYVLDHFRVGELWTSPEFPGPDGYGAEILEIARRKGVPHRVLRAGDVAWEGPEESIRALAPPSILYDDVNDNSLVLRVEADGASALFPGDVGIRSETRMVLSGEVLRAGLLKAPHHGSRTSSSEAFLEAVQPEKAVISVGANNRYGLPDEEILERIAQFGAEVLRLDQTGAIAFEWKHDKWERVIP